MALIAAQVSRLDVPYWVVAPLLALAIGMVVTGIVAVTRG